MEQLRTHISEGQYRAAFGTIRAAKNWFWWLIVAAVVVQLVAFVLVRFVGVIDDSPAVISIVQAPATTTRSVAEISHRGKVWYELLCWVLPATKFIALAAGMLLILTLMFAVKLSLLGHIGGVAGFMSGFFWSILLWVFLIPWQQVLQSSFASGALYNLHFLVKHTQDAVWSGSASLITQILYYARFVAYPIFMILLALVVQAKFARGYRRMALSVAEAVRPQA